MRLRRSRRENYSGLKWPHAHKYTRDWTYRSGFSFTAPVYTARHSAPQTWATERERERHLYKRCQLGSLDWYNGEQHACQHIVYTVWTGSVRPPLTESDQSRQKEWCKFIIIINNNNAFTRECLAYLISGLKMVMGLARLPDSNQKVFPKGMKTHPKQDKQIALI